MRHLVIVRRDKPSLYEYLKTHMEKPEEVLVVLDRRVGERRQQTIPAPVELRTRQRRVSLSPKQEKELEEMGFTIVEISD